MGDSFLDAIEQHDLDRVRKELSSRTINYCISYLSRIPPCVGPPLYLASEKGYTDIVEVLLAHEDIKVNLLHNFTNWGSTTNKGLLPRTSLSIAVEKGHTDIVKLLISRDDIDLNVRAEGHLAPLYSAISNRHVDILKLLLPLATNINYIDKDKGTLLFFSVQMGCTDIVALLLAREDIQMNIQHRWETPLLLAANKGHVEIVHLLISRVDTDLNKADKHGRTPLLAAISEGHIHVVKLLLPKLDIRNMHFYGSRKYLSNKSILKDVIEKKNTCIIELLVLKDDIDLVSKAGEGYTTLKRAMIENDIATIKPFLPLEKEYDWNSAYEYDGPITISTMNIRNREIIEQFLARHGMLPRGQTLLSWAAENGYNALVRFLLDKEGLNPNVKGDNGRTPLSQAAENGHEMTIRIFLMNERTNLNLRDEDGRTPLLQAAGKGHELVVRLLLGKQVADSSKTTIAWENEDERELLLTRDGANPNLKDNNGYTALSQAIESGHRSIVTLLAPIDTMTMFMLVQEGNRRAVNSLFHANSNLDERNGQGQTPLHAAILSGQLEIMKDLLSYGMDIDVQDSDNMTPLQLAMRKKDERLIRELLKRKASMNEIMANEWRDTYDKDDKDIVLFFETETGERYVAFTTILPTADQISNQPSGIDRRLYSFIDTPHHSPWSRVPITHSKETLRPNELLLSMPRNIDDSSFDISVSLWISTEGYLDSGLLTISAANTYRIAWKMVRSTKPGNPWISTVYFSTLPNGWMPENEMDLFKQFIFYVKRDWVSLCKQCETYLSRRRLEQLGRKGKSPDMIDFLANDARKLAELRSILHDQVQAAEKFVKDYCRYYNANKIPIGLLEVLTDDFELVVNKRIGQLDQVIRDLLQIEFAWASINETRVSTRLGQNVMLLTYVSIFYLPLGFCAALWAIPNITDSSTRNPFIATSIVIGLATLLITLNMERISGVVKQMLVYGKNITGANTQRESGHNGVDARKTSQRARFRDHIVAVVKVLTGKKEQQKQNSSKV